MERVLADDFSGAAEVAGAAFRYGLKAAVQLDPRLTPECDLAVFDSDSRSKPRADAVGRIRSALDQHDWVFKKIDSALRGHVIAEIQPFLESGRYRRALVVPINPALGRTITDGVYCINGRPISETPFRDDPEYPAHASDVRSMLGPGAFSICRLSDPLPATGIIVGEGQTDLDLHGWAARVDGATVPVGAAPFFAACLEARGRSVTRQASREAGGSTLVVSGTVARIVNWPNPVPMPERLFREKSPQVSGQWLDQVAAMLEQTGFAVASIGNLRAVDRSQSARLVQHLADLAASVLAGGSVNQMWLEGGATASAVVRTMGWKLLHVVGELAPGVVQLRYASAGPLLVVKPGSYPWPG